MQHNDALEFCQEWLAAWTGNQPERLIEFYAEGAYYRDPARPGGLHGHAEIYPYFVKLLAANPAWTWQPLEVFPTERGFSLKWQAAIPVDARTVVEIGLDLVELADRRITRNEVYFDRLALATTTSG